MNDMSGNPYAEAHQHRPGVTEDDGHWAIAQATLALAYEQRTANLIAQLDMRIAALGKVVEMQGEVAVELNARLGVTAGDES